VQIAVSRFFERVELHAFERHVHMVRFDC